MEPEQYRRLRDIFDRLSQLPAAQRRDELDRALPPGDPLRPELESWLASAELLVTESATRTEAATVAAGDTPTMAAPPPLAAGAVLGGRYKLMRLLGAGGFSQAYLAEDSMLHGKQVVVKIPLPDPSHNDAWFERHFTDEIRALAALNHPGIVDVLDTGKDDAHGGFFTEQFIEGPTLSQLMRRNPLGMDRAVRMLEKIADALAAAHAKGVIHRDLKPQNIQVRMAETRQELPVLIDFGIASVLGPEGDTGVTTRVAGTPDYLAPEQALGKVLPQSDLYAFGCIVVELLTGEKLHARLVRAKADTTPQMMAVKLLDEKLPAAPQEVREKLSKLLSVNPAERGTAVEYEALFHAWPRQDQSVPPLPTQSALTAAAVTQAPPQPPPSRRGLLAGAGAAAVLGAGALIWRSGSSTETPVVGKPKLRLTVKAVRSNAAGIGAISPRDGVVTRNDKLRLQVTATPEAYCYLFGESMASSIASATEMNLLFPPRKLDRPLANLTVPSTANDWIEFDNKPEILRFLFMASREPLAEADAAVESGRGNDGVVRDAKIREALEARVRQAGAAAWSQGEADAWIAEADGDLLCIEGRMQHLAV